MVYNVLFASGLGHSNSNLVKLPNFRFLLSGKPRWGGIPVFTPSSFCIRPNLCLMVGLPNISVFAQYVRWASGGAIDDRFTVFLVPLILTIFDFFAPVVLRKVVDAFGRCLGPLNF